MDGPVMVTLYNLGISSTLATIAFVHVLCTLRGAIARKRPIKMEG